MFLQINRIGRRCFCPKMTEKRISTQEVTEGNRVSVKSSVIDFNVGEGSNVLMSPADCELSKQQRLGIQLNDYSGAYTLDNNLPMEDGEVIAAIDSMSNQNKEE